MQTMTIGQVAKATDLGIETIRYYERRGLIEKPARRPSGYRQFSGQAVRQLRFIKRAKRLGFSLKQIKELLELRLDPQATCQDVKERAQKKIAEISKKIETLQQMQHALGKLTAACEGSADVSECPILEALEREGPDHETPSDITF